MAEDIGGQLADLGKSVGKSAVDQAENVYKAARETAADEAKITPTSMLNQLGKQIYLEKDQAKKGQLMNQFNELSEVVQRIKKATARYQVEASQQNFQIEDFKTQPFNPQIILGNLVPPTMETGFFGSEDPEAHKLNVDNWFTSNVSTLAKNIDKAYPDLNPSVRQGVLEHMQNAMYKGETDFSKAIDYPVPIGRYGKKGKSVPLGKNLDGFKAPKEPLVLAPGGKQKKTAPPKVTTKLWNGKTYTLKGDKWVEKPAKK